MNHVPQQWLQRLRWGVLAYIGLLVVAYVVVVALGLVDVQMELTKTSAYIIVGAILAAQAIYEACAFIFLRAKQWPRAIVTYAFAAVVSLVLIEITGVYESPFAFPMLGLLFVAPALSPYLAVGMVGMLVFGLILGLAGLFRTPTQPLAGIAVIGMAALCSLAGYFLWRKYYEHTKGSVDTLSSSLSKEQAKSDIILGAIEDGVVLVDASKTIRLFNPGASKITGWPVEEALGLDHKAVLQLVDEKDAPYTEAQNPFVRVFEEKKTIRDSRAILASRSNKRISLNINVSPLLDQAGAVTGAVAVFRDVSEERSEEKRRAEFISTASHEMRTPVAAIEGYLALAMNDRVSKIDSKAHEYLEKAHASTQHLGKLFQDLLTSAKAEDGRLSNHPSVVEMGEFLEKLTDDLRFAAEKKGLHMEFVVGTVDQVIDASGGSDANNKMVRPLYYTKVDPERLREVITNLFDNAVKYTEAGTVSIGLTGDDKVVQLYIRDTGSGIPAEDIPHLFQKFYRVDSSATRTIGGTGLGLFISRKIVELYNGRVWVESEVGKGSTFFINLPRISNQQASQMQAQEATNATVIGA